jgi:hypothetical protein
MLTPHIHGAAVEEVIHNFVGYSTNKRIPHINVVVGDHCGF